VESTLANPALDAALDVGRLSPLERFLRLFTDVRPGEGSTAVLMFANVFLILCAYYFIKPLREGWISISDVSGLSKMEVKAYSSFGQSLVLVPVVAWYGRLAQRLPRAKLIGNASLFCISNMVIFWALQPGIFFDHLPTSGIVFYLWVGIFGVFVVAQFWAFAADLYDDGRGRRILPVIAIGATAGAAGGAWVAEQLVRTGIVPTKHLLLAATVPLGLSILLTRVVDAREGPGGGRPAAAPGDQADGLTRSAIELVLRNRFLVAVAGITLLLNWVNTNGENLLFRVVQEALARDAGAVGLVEGSREALEYTRDGTTLFYGDFFFWVNLCALGLQAFVASRLLKYGGVGAILMLLPVISLVSYTAMWIVPVLAVVKLMKIAENATDYSINNTARHVLWLPVPAGMTYQGKPTIDTLVTRLGDGLAAVTALVGVQLLDLATDSYFVFNSALVLVWIALSFDVIRRHRQLGEEAKRT
jgi:AAA family ATP:ADP antiporter